MPLPLAARKRMQIDQLEWLENRYRDGDAYCLFDAIRQCGEWRIAVPNWVYIACANITATIPKVNSWEKVLGSLHNKRYEKYRTALLVGECVTVVRDSCGITVEAALKIITKQCIGRLREREIESAWTHYKSIPAGANIIKEPKAKAKLVRSRTKDPTDTDAVRSERKLRDDKAFIEIEKILKAANLPKKVKRTAM
jgi:hypothetical protein